MNAAKPSSFQPMNINFGLLPPLAAPTKDQAGQRLKGKARGKAKKKLMAERALNDHAIWRSTVASQLRRDMINA